MRAFQFASFGIEALQLVETDDPNPGPGEITVDVEAASLNFRDALVVEGQYNPNIELPATPLSDAAGVVSAVGRNVQRFAVGDRVMTHFVSDWVDGPFEKRYVTSTLGVPAAGVAAERVVLPERAVVPVPAGFDSAKAATLPIAALTAWNVLVTEGDVKPGQWVLTLGTGGVSIFALLLGKALGAHVLITSSSDEKLERARDLGADVSINYLKTPRWDKEVLAATGGLGADIVVETAGVATLSTSLKAARASGLVGVLGGVTGLSGEVQTAPLTMKRLRVHGILVDSRSSFERLVRFLDEHPIEPVIDRRFRFEQLPQALRYMQSGRHFGKIVLEFGR